MYGLPQAGKTASDFLLPRLKATRYHPAKHTHGLFTHETNGIMFCLVVDNFGVKDPNRAAAEHLRNTLQEHYTITEDWEGTNYCELDLDWHYELRHLWIRYACKAIKWLSAIILSLSMLQAVPC